jgi:tetratricopeptide (TPR) repeat protein
MKKICKISLIIQLSVCLYAFAAEDSDEAWLRRIVPNARIQALGGAGVAIKDNSSLLYVNPGSIAHRPYGNITVFYGNLNDSAHKGYVEYVYPFTSWGSLGASIEASSKNRNNYLQLYSFGLSLGFMRGVSAGITAKTIRKVLDDEAAQDYGVDAGVMISPFSWFNLGAKLENLRAPELEYENSQYVETLARNLQAGVNIFKAEYFNLTADVYAEDIQEENGEMSLEGAYGIEIYPDEALAIRGGIRGDYWTTGFGIISKNMDFDYALTTELEDMVHYLQFTYKFGVAPTRKEKELIEKAIEVNRETIYLEALKYFNLEDIASAIRKIDEYIEKYGRDSKINNLEQDIDNWLDKVRKENMGKADILKKEIMKDYYQGKLEHAIIKLNNLKLLAPNYESVEFLDSLLQAGIYLESGKYSEAESELIKALKMEPDSKEVIDLYNRLQEVMKLSE